MSSALEASEAARDALAGEHAVHDYDSGPPVPRAKFAMWLFLGTEAMFFTGLIAAYLVLRSGAPDWPDPARRLAVGLTAFNTVLLMASYVPMTRAVATAARGDRRGLSRALAATLLLGAAFLAIQGFEYAHLIRGGARPNVDLFWSVFFTLTCFHGLHVAAGIVWLGALWASRAANPLRVELAGMYWHFVDLVWVVLFCSVYLF